MLHDKLVHERSNEKIEMQEKMMQEKMHNLQMQNKEMPDKMTMMMHDLTFCLRRHVRSGKSSLLDKNISLR